MNRRILSLVGLVLAVTAVTAASTAATLAYSNVAKEAPFTITSHVFDSTRGYQVGGVARVYIANDSLRVGDVVFDTAANRVAKSATLAMYNKVIGVVVGGARTSNRAAVDSTDVGTLAATANQRVIVVRYGRVWTKLADSAYFGDQLIPSTAVAGTVKRRTTAIDSFHRVLGRAVFTRDSGKAMLLDLGMR